MAYSMGYGTKVIRQYDGTLLIVSPDEEHELQDGEEELTGVRGVHIHIEPDDVIYADMDIMMTFTSIHAKRGACRLFAKLPEFAAEDKEVEYVKFTDGTEWHKEEK